MNLVSVLVLLFSSPHLFAFPVSFALSILALAYSPLLPIP